MRAWSLAHLTVLDLPPPEVIETAHQAGYTHAGLRLLPAAPGGVAYDLMTNKPLLRETRARLAATGIAVFDLEIIRLGPGFTLDPVLSVLDTGALLDARAVLVAGDDPDFARLTANYAAFCTAAAARGLTADIEFMPWTEVPDIASAQRLVAAAGTPANAGILVDALHYARSPGGPEAVAALPGSWLHYAQLCDAPAAIPPTRDELISDARTNRLAPGEGGIDLAGLLRALPPGLPLSIEIPNHQRARARGPRGWAADCLRAAQQVVAAAGVSS
ncbi:sugar phosphate isomerase/epimerase [Acidocella sp.]|uniref:sugar phosphate isomerase/epimerase family protein n=1 Tax=Acidocella sp. TaxID=50710 RepID=UPI002627D694|nr:TIM barrel protein [Acidocella sp.]